MNDATTDETKDAHAERIRLAERQHDRMDRAGQQHFQQVEAFAVLTIRSLILVAIGGIAAVLGFYSANFDILSERVGSLDQLNWILGCLFISLLLTLLGSACGYFSQIMFAAHLAHQVRTYVHPYSEQSDKSKPALTRGNIFRYGAIVFCFAAAFALIWAGFTFIALVH